MRASTQREALGRVVKANRERERLADLRYRNGIAIFGGGRTVAN